MTCLHEYTPNPDDNDSGGSSISLDNDGNVSCSLCGQKWLNKIITNSTIEDRLKSVIGSLEYSQSKNYNPITNMTLAYLYDILNDKVPEHILEIKKPKTIKTIVPDGVKRYLDLELKDKLVWKFEVLDNRRCVIVTKKGSPKLNEVNTV